MARSQDGGQSPDGGLVTVDKSERDRLKTRRKERGPTQEDLARKLRRRVTAATISNFETGRHPQVERTLYADIKWALRDETNAEDLGEIFIRIVDGASQLDATGLRAVDAVIDSLKKPR